MWSLLNNKTNMNRDPKVIAIWVLSIVLITIAGLWIREMVDSPSLSAELGNKEQDLKEACADMNSEDGRNKCLNALEETKDFLGDLTQ